MTYPNPSTCRTGCANCRLFQFQAAHTSADPPCLHVCFCLTVSVSSFLLFLYVFAPSYLHLCSVCTRFIHYSPFFSPLLLLLPSSPPPPPPPPLLGCLFASQKPGQEPCGWLRPGPRSQETRSFEPHCKDPRLLTLRSSAGLATVVTVYSGTSDKGPSEIGATSLQRTLVVAQC